MSVIPEIITVVLSIGGLAAIFGVGYIKLRENVATLKSQVASQKELITDVQGTVKNIDCKIEKLDSKVDGAVQRIGSMEVKVEIWWESVQKIMIKVLHEPDRPLRDMLTEKLDSKDITIKELKQLKGILRKDFGDSSRKDERMAIGYLLISVDRAINLCDSTGVTSYKECFERHIGFENIQNFNNQIQQLFPPEDKKK